MIGAPRAFQQIAFPMAGQRAIRDVGGPLTNGDGVDDLALRRTDASAGARMSKVALAAELPEQGALEHTATLNKQTSINRLGRHLHLRIAWKRVIEASPRFAEATTAARASSQRRAGEQGAWPAGTVWDADSGPRRVDLRAAARYRVRPPFRATSRLIVDGARRRARLMARNDRPRASCREISSRSVTVNASRDRRRGRGATPPSAPRCRRPNSRRA